MVSGGEEGNLDVGLSKMLLTQIFSFPFLSLHRVTTHTEGVGQARKPQGPLHRPTGRQAALSTGREVQGCNS